MASTYLTKTLGTPTNNKKFTFSCWVKKNAVASTMDIFHAGADGPNEAIMCRFESEGHITIKHDVGGTQEMLKQTNAKYRDPNAWYHIVTVFDTDNSTAEDRQRIYVNGERITDWLSGSDDNFSQGDDVLANKAVSHTIGKRNFDSAHYLDAVLSHVHFCDGQAYDASYFGSTDSTTGEWKINTSPSVTYGNNGFFILKDGNSVTDQSGEGNNWTVAGGTLTKTEDCPSNVFATLNPLVRNKSYNDGTLTNGNLGFAPNGRAVTCSTLGVTSGKYYAEFKATDAGGLYLGAGLMKGITSQGQTNPIWYDNTTGYAIAIADNGTLQAGSSTSASYGPTFADNDIIGIALDMDNKEMYIHKNGTYMNSGDPTSGANKTGGVTGALSYNPFDDGEEVFFMVADISAGGVGECQCNFGNGYFGTTAISSAGTNASNIGIFEYDVPSGYTALCTKGLNE